MKKWAAVFIGIVLLAVIIVAVRHEKPKKAEAPYALLEGTLESDEVDVSSKIPGRLASVMVDEGDFVRPGTVLAILESKEVNAKLEQASGMYEAAKAQESQARLGVELQAKTVNDQVRQAEAGYAAAKAKLDMALNGARPQEVRQAEAAVEQAKAAFNTAKVTYDRFHGLYKDGVIPKQQEDEIELKYLSAKSNLEAAEARLSLVHEGARKEEIEAARQGVKAAQAQLDMAKDAALQVSLREQDVTAAGHKAQAARGQLDEAEAYEGESRIISPIGGYVSERMSESGEIVSAGYPIFTIVKDTNFKVEVYADETKFGHVRIHDTVKVIIPALGDRQLQGRVIRISPAADFATKKATNMQGSFDIRSLGITVAVEPNADLRNGMSARVKLPTRR